jgi:amino acid transporter
MSTKQTVMKREFTTMSAFAIAFAFVSPIVALYSVLGFGLGIAGPAFIWSGLALYAGQLLVVLALAVLASKWSDSGGIYQWSRRLLGERYGWFASWTYIWTLLVTLPAVAYAGATFIPPLLDMTDATPEFVTWLAVGLVAIGTLINLAGRAVIKVVMIAVIIAEAVGSIGVAVWLLLFNQSQTLEFISPASIGSFEGAFFMAPFVFALAVASYFAIGFESASSISEEVKNPRKAVPKAMVTAFTTIAVIVLLSTLAFTLAIPNAEFLTDPETSGDPAVAIMQFALPEPIFRVILVLFLIAFVACLMTVQITVSRLVWATTRNGELPFAKALSSLSGKTGLPRAAVVVTGVIAALLFIPFQSDEIQYALIAFSSLGFFVSFLFPIAGVAIARVRGNWNDDKDLYLGRAGRVVMWLALVWLLFQIVNVAWPRESGSGWLTDWASVIGGLGIAIVGVIVEAWVERKRRLAKADGKTLVLAVPAGDGD